MSAASSNCGVPSRWVSVGEGQSVWGWVTVGRVTAPTDILGNTRFIDGDGDGSEAWDIGAYEFNSFKAPRFTIAPQPIPEGWRLTLSGEPNQWVGLQRSGDLADWQETWSGRMGVVGAAQVADTDQDPQAISFYRVVVP